MSDRNTLLTASSIDPARSLGLARLTRRRPDIEPAVARVGLDPVQLLLLKFEVAQRAQTLLDLRPAAGTHERAGDHGLSEPPGDRHLRQALSTSLSDVIQCAHIGEIGLAEHRLSE